MPVTEIVLFCLGAFIGSLVSVILLPSTDEIRRVRDELDQLKSEHSSYRTDVSQHFHKTAELVGEMTQSYKRVYDHLAGGAQTLCEVPSGEGTLPFSGAPLIEIAGEPIRPAAGKTSRAAGARAAAAAAAAAPTAAGDDDDDDAIETEAVADAAVDEADDAGEGATAEHVGAEEDDREDASSDDGLKRDAAG